MRTLGIDLAAEATNTAACLVEWQGRRASVVSVESRLDDPQLLDLIHSADKVGIDAPFGWPDDFVDAVAGHRNLEPWPGLKAGDEKKFRARLSFRETDRQVNPVRRPLSVSTDKIGVTAMRCAGLLQRIGDVDRAGFGKVLEVYPAAALQRWGQRASRYKNKHATHALPEMVRALHTALPALDLGGFAPALGTSDHAFDALICSLVARAAALGLTGEPDASLRSRAQREGWIHLPMSDSLASLASPH